MLQTSSMRDLKSVSTRYDVARLITLVLLCLFGGLVVLIPALFGPRIVEILTLKLALTQDLAVVPIILVAALLRPSATEVVPLDRPANGISSLVISMGVILLAGWIGQYLVFQGYQISRDEQMAVFDQAIFAHGRLLWPFPVEWRFVADALNRRFILPIGANEFWVSGYLPIHSLFRAFVGTIGDSALASPIMAATGAAGMWAVARTLWSESNRTVGLALLLLVTSSQVLITSMTAFSMSMHLALNLVWLALFVADTKRTHTLAVIVGFLATGIHQPLFHPLFVLPFLGLLAHQRRWHLLGFYLGAYGIIAAFWLAYPFWITSHGVNPTTVINCANANCTGGVGFVERLFSVLTGFDWQHIWMTAANLLRFICWQHPLLVPLALFGTMSCWRAEPFTRALAIGFVLPVVLTAIIIPWQGHGWGYRYVHPVLGNAILLACFGFRRIEESGLSLRRPLLIASAFAILVLPVHAWMASRMVPPYLQISKELASTHSDAVIVDTDRVPYGQDVVINRFDLSNRPKLLIASLIKPADLAVLCKRSTIAFYDAPRMAPLARLFGTRVPTEQSPQMRRLRGSAQASHCTVVE